MAFDEPIKQGDDYVKFHLSRSNGVLRVNVRAHQVVEKFMNEASVGMFSKVELLGRHWQQVSPEPLEAYTIKENLPVIDGPDGFVMHLVGRPLVDDNTGLTNLSLLRLTGISSPGGVTFSVPGVHSMDQMTKLGSRLQLSARRFCLEFLRPIGFTLALVAEKRGE